MAERCTSKATAASSFGRRHLHEDEARLLYEADYPPPPEPTASSPTAASTLTGGLAAVLDYIETDNTPHPSFSRRRGSSWTPRRMEPGSSSSSGSGSPALHPVRPEPEETPLQRRTRNGALVINEGGRSSPRSLHLVWPKPEPGLLLVKPEHANMVAPDDEAALKWAKEDYVREQVLRQCKAYAELQAQRRRGEEGGVIVLDGNDEGEAGPSNPPPRVGDLGQGCNRDGGGTGWAHDDDGGDYTHFYSLLGM